MANNSFLPTQIGSTSPNSSKGSTVIIGKDTSSTTVEAIGFGPNGRPDYVSVVTINLSDIIANSKLGSISFDVLDLQDAQTAGAPQNLLFTLKEVKVCENGTAKKMMILASQTYT